MNQIEQSDSRSPVRKGWEKVCNKFRDYRENAVSWMVLVLLHVYGVPEATFAEIRDRRYKDQPDPENTNLDDVGDVNLVYEIAKETFEEAEGRLETTMSKCKTLFRVSSLLLGLLAFVLPKISASSSTTLFWIALSAMVGLTASLLLVAYLFDVNTFHRVKLDGSEVSLPSNDLRKSMINSLLTCAGKNNSTNRLLVDVYKSARFYYLSATVLVVVAFCWASFSIGDESQETIEALRGDPALIRLLSGPEGSQGAIGPAGKPGLRGAQGAPGKDAVINYEVAAEKILASETFGDLLSSTVESELQKLGEKDNSEANIESLNR